MSKVAVKSLTRSDMRRIALHWLPLVLALAVFYLLDLSLAYFDESRQYMLGWGGFAIIIVTFKLDLFKRPPWRFVFIIVAAFLAARYLVWRSSVSLVYTGFWDFIGMSSLYLAEVYSMIALFLGFFVNLWPMRNRPALLPTDPTLYPTVDVFIPTYNESPDIVRITVVAATQLDYPKDKIRIYICDDGGTLNKRTHPETGKDAWEHHYQLRQMAQELGVLYLTRENNHSAKAGNINHALNHTHGDLILILDCDHVPTRDFLSRTVEYFIADPKLYLVQTPHFFVNPSPIEANMVGAGNPNAESDMFYREIHRSIDFWNASYFCGSAAVLRREHLNKIGGFYGKTITEDAETALRLHCAGLNSTYMDMPMVCGLAPDNYDSYVLQRTRWAQGMTQMLVMHNPLTIPGLTLQQRLCYFNSCYFWLFGFARIMFFISPALFLLFGLKIYHVSLGPILAIALPYVLSTFLVMDFFYGRTRQPLFSEIYESIQAVFLLPAVISVFLNPARPAFKVTPKGQQQQDEALNARAATFLVIIILCIFSLGAAVLRWIDLPVQRDTIIVTGVWCIYNMFLALVALGAFWERRQVRNTYRINVQERVRLFIPHLNLNTEGTTTDITLNGVAFSVKLPHPPQAKDHVFITVPLPDGTDYTFHGQMQRIRKEGDNYHCGVKFLIDGKSFPKAVAFVYGNSARWLNIWKQKAQNPGSIRMLNRFLMLGLKGVLVSSVLLLRLLGSAFNHGGRRAKSVWKARAKAAV